MPAMAFAVPVLPGKEDEHRQLDEELMGSRRPEYTASRKRLGIHREASWHQQTPDGTLALIYIEADDPGAAMAGMGSSDDPFDVWFRGRVSDIFGIDLSQPGPPLSQGLDATF